MIRIAGGPGRVTAVIERQAPEVETISETFSGDGPSARHLPGRYDVQVMLPGGWVATFAWQPSSPDEPIPQVGTLVEYELRSLD